MAYHTTPYLLLFLPAALLFYQIIQTKELLDQITGMCDHGDFMEEEQKADLCMGE